MITSIGVGTYNIGDACVSENTIATRTVNKLCANMMELFVGVNFCALKSDLRDSIKEYKPKKGFRKVDGN